MDKFYGWLDAHVFPRLIAYTTHRVHISAMLLLWIALLLAGKFTSFELVGGNYTNGLSALTACVILLQQGAHHREMKRIHAEHAEQIAKVHEAVKARRDAKTGRYVKAG